MINLPVPYKSQWDGDARSTANDCGPASIAMILNYYGENFTTDHVFSRTGAGSSLIGIPALVKAIEAFGYKTTRYVQSTPAKLKEFLDQGIPAIALVKYGSLGPTVQDKTFKGGHFFVVVGYRDDGYFVNDPNFKAPHRQDGDHHFFPKADFERAWADAAKDNNQPNSFQVIHRKVTSMYTEEQMTAVRLERDKNWDSYQESLKKIKALEEASDKAATYAGNLENNLEKATREVVTLKATLTATQDTLLVSQNLAKQLQKDIEEHVCPPQIPPNQPPNVEPSILSRQKDGVLRELITWLLFLNEDKTK